MLFLHQDSHPGSLSRLGGDLLCFFSSDLPSVLPQDSASFLIDELQPPGGLSC
jgi:hypothetical protein